jgi:hypothetical protein
MSWVEKFFQEIQEERKKKFPLDFYNLTEGEHVLLFHLTVEPQVIRTKYGERIAFVVSKDGKDYYLLLNRRSPLFRSIVNLLKPHIGEKAVTLKIIRAGTKSSTRYSVTYVQGWENGKEKKL